MKIIKFLLYYVKIDGMELIITVNYTAHRYGNVEGLTVYHEEKILHLVHTT